MEHMRGTDGRAERGELTRPPASPHANGTYSRAHRAQALTEFALILPLLALLFVGVLDLGRAFHTEVAASNAARVGILYAQQVASPRMLDECLVIDRHNATPRCRAGC